MYPVRSQFQRVDESISSRCNTSLRVQYSSAGERASAVGAFPATSLNSCFKSSRLTVTLTFVPARNKSFSSISEGFNGLIMYRLDSSESGDK